MNSYYIIIVSTLCISILHAADNTSNILTFNTYQIHSSNIERDPPTILHKLDWNHKETRSKKTFKTLCNEAHKKGLPWIVTPCIMAHPQKGLIMEYLDTATLLRKASLDNLRYKSLSKTICNALLKFASKEYPDADVAVTHNLSFYPLGQNKPMIPITQFTGVDKSKAEKIKITDVSICLAIRLHNNYDDLKTLVRMTLVTSTAESFSNNTYDDNTIIKAAHHVNYMPPHKEISDTDVTILEGFCSAFWKKYYENLSTDVQASLKDTSK